MPILEFFKTLFCHHRLIREHITTNNALKAQIDLLQQGIRVYHHAIMSLAEPPTTEEEVKLEPIRIPRRSYTEMQVDWELAHNKKLRDAIARQKAGIR